MMNIHIGNLELMIMIEKDFIQLLDKTTYCAAFSMLDPKLEVEFKNNIQQIKQCLTDRGDTYSDEAQEWALKLLLRESVDDYIQIVINDIYMKAFYDGVQK